MSTAEPSDYLKHYNIDTVAEALHKVDPRYSADAWRREILITQSDKGVDFPQSVVIALVDNASELR